MKLIPQLANMDILNPQLAWDCCTDMECGHKNLILFFPVGENWKFVKKNATVDEIMR
jgi:hypothetical protein